MTARRPSRGGGLGIEARAEVARCAAKAWTAQYSTAQSMVGGTTATTVGDLELRPGSCALKMLGSSVTLTTGDCIKMATHNPNMNFHQMEA